MAVTRVFGKSSTEAAQRELARLTALQSFDLLDTPRDEGFDRLARLIKEIFCVDIGLVSLIDAHRQWYMACSGLTNGELPRDDTFCRYVLDYDEPVIVSDATKDPRFSENPAVTGEAHIRFYAGVPLKTREGFAIGTVCAIDRRPRSFGSRDLTVLQELAGAAMDRIELLQSAATDGLTGALTRRAFKKEADRLISASLKEQRDLSCIVLDIDHFKLINDTHGHAAGDEVLKTIASACSAALRREDLFGRLGGEEFAFLLPGIDRDRALTIAETIRMAISAREVRGAFGVLHVTASLGASSLSIVSKDIETLLAQADTAMYRAKQGGRNRSVSWSSIQIDGAAGPRRRVLKAGAIIFNNRRSTIDCSIKTLGSGGAGLSVSNSDGIPAEFVLAIAGEGFETHCKVIARDRQHIEVEFR